jgi:hypothetical protein
MNNETTESIVKRMMALEVEKTSLLNSLEKEAIRLIQESIGVIKCRPKGYEFGLDLRRAQKELDAAIHGTHSGTARISDEGTKTRQRVNRAEKNTLFTALLSEFRQDNPEADQMPFMELTRRLAEKGFEPRSVSIFLRDQLAGRETKGATRNKTLLLDGNDQQPSNQERGATT